MWNPRVSDLFVSRLLISSTTTSAVVGSSRRWCTVKLNSVSTIDAPANVSYELVLVFCKQKDVVLRQSIGVHQKQYIYDLHCLRRRIQKKKKKPEEDCFRQAWFLSIIMTDHTMPKWQKILNSSSRRFSVFFSVPKLQGTDNASPSTTNFRMPLRQSLLNGG